MGSSPFFAQRRIECPLASVAGLGDCGGVATNTQKELAALRIDVLVAASHEVIDVLDDLQHSPALVQDLGGNARLITIVDAVVPSLKDRPEPFLELVDRSFPRIVLVARIHGHIVGARYAEQPDLGIRPRNACVEEIADEFVTRAKKTY